MSDPDDLIAPTPTQVGILFNIVIGLYATFFFFFKATHADYASDAREAPPSHGKNPSAHGSPTVHIQTSC
jgi:hypothetical protein